MENNITFLTAFIAGIVSFLSPCIFPLIPVYIGLLSGSYSNTDNNAKQKLYILISAVLFVAGFSIVFAGFSFVLSTSFMLLGGIKRIVDIVSGIVIIILGLNMLFNFISILNYEKRFTVKRPANLIQSFIFGLAFGAAWTPCVGTILGSILILASQQGNAQQSIMYLLTYSAGLGLPLIAAAVFLRYFLKIQKQVLSFLPYINKASAILIIALGIVIVFGKMNLLLAYLY